MDDSGGVGSAVAGISTSATATPGAQCRYAFFAQPFARTVGHAHAAGAAGSVPSTV